LLAGGAGRRKYAARTSAPWSIRSLKDNDHALLGNADIVQRAVDSSSVFKRKKDVWRRLSSATT